MTTTHQTHNLQQTAQAASGKTDPHKISWQEVKDLGLDPAPADLAEDDDETQQS